MRSVGAALLKPRRRGRKGPDGARFQRGQSTEKNDAIRLATVNSDLAPGGRSTSVVWRLASMPRSPSPATPESSIPSSGTRSTASDTRSLGASLARCPFRSLEGTDPVVISGQVSLDCEPLWSSNCGLYWFKSRPRHQPKLRKQNELQRSRSRPRSAFYAKT